MPELPEVEVVRVGLQSAVDHAQVVGVQVFDARSLKRHSGGKGNLAHAEDVSKNTPRSATRNTQADEQLNNITDFEHRLAGAQLGAPARRGKFLWIPILEDGQQKPTQALLAHLGMSGQLLLRAHEALDDKHVRVRIWLTHPRHGSLRIDFVDQRIFGSLAIESLVPTRDGHPAGWGTDLAMLPSQVAHISRDPLDQAFDDDAFVRALTKRNTSIKRALLDQTLVSGIGNIYADEALWRVRVHPETSAQLLTQRKTHELLESVREVFAQALAEGGTSFDAQYVNVNGQAGYFAHSLNAYGRTGQPCPRCATAIKRVQFMNRSSHYCPRCQRKRNA